MFRLKKRQPYGKMKMFILSLSFLKGIGCILGKYFDRWVRSYSVTPENSPEFFDIINDL